MGAPSALQSHSPAWPRQGKPRNLNPLPPPRLTPTNRQKEARGLCPPRTSRAVLSTPPCRRPQHSLPLLSQTAHPVPSGHFPRPLVPTGRPRARPNCPQGPCPPPNPGEAHPQPFDKPPTAHTAPFGSSPKPPAGWGALPSGFSEHGKRLRGARGGSSARARLGRRAPTWPWERARGGTGPRRPLRAGGWRGTETRLGGEALTSLGATATTPASGSQRAATPWRPATAPNIYPHPGGRGGGAGRELARGHGPGHPAPLSQRRVAVRAGRSRHRPPGHVSAASAGGEADAEGRGGAGASLVPWPNGDGSGGPVRGGPAPRRAAAGERCALRQLGGVRPARLAGGRGPPL